MTARKNDQPVQRRTAWPFWVGLAVTSAVFFLCVAWWWKSAPAPADSAPSPSAAAPASSRIRDPRPPWQAVQLSGAAAHDDEAARTGSLAGSVLSKADGRGIPHARLSFSAGAQLHTIIADPQGRFRFEPPRPGLYELALVHADGFLPFAPEWGHSPIVFAARAGERLDDATVYLTPRVAYTGVVVGPDGSKVGGARVRILDKSDAGANLEPESDEWISDAAGEFRFHAHDGALLEARHPDHAPGRARLGFSAQVAKRLTIRLNPADQPRWGNASIRGIVVDPRRQPVPDALVVASPRVENNALPGVRLLASGRAVTDAGGKFTIHGLDTRAHSLVAAAPGYGPARLARIDVPAEGVVLTITPPGAIEGAVAAEGKPVPAFTVFVSQQVGALERSSAAVASQFDADGYYLVSDLSPGEYFVSVAAQGFAPSQPRKVTVAGDLEDPARADFDLVRGASLHGRVSDAETKAPLEGARVSVEADLRAEPAAPVTSTLTDSEGRFVLLGLGNGPLSILVAAADHHGRIVSGIELGPEKEAGPVIVELTPTDEGEEPRIELAGIGVVMSAKDDRLIIGQVVEGGGAAEAGLAPGHAILAVEGRDVADLGFQGAIEAIRGPEGSIVRLTVVAGEEEPRVVSVQRKKIRS